MRKAFFANKSFLGINTFIYNYNNKIMFLMFQNLIYNLNFFFKIKKKESFCKLYYKLDEDKKKFIWLTKKHLLYTYISIIRNCFTNSVVGWCVELEMIGLGFKIILLDKRIIPFYGMKYNKIRFDGGFSHLVDFKLSSTIFVKKKKRRNFILYGFSLRELHSFLDILMKFRPVGPYKMRGLKVKGFRIKLKPGKNK